MADYGTEHWRSRWLQWGVSARKRCQILEHECVVKTHPLAHVQNYLQIERAMGLRLSRAFSEPPRVDVGPKVGKLVTPPPSPSSTETVVAPEPALESAPEPAPESAPEPAPEPVPTPKKQAVGKRKLAQLKRLEQLAEADYTKKPRR